MVEDVEKTCDECRASTDQASERLNEFRHKIDGRYEIAPQCNPKRAAGRSRGFLKVTGDAEGPRLWGRRFDRKILDEVRMIWQKR